MKLSILPTLLALAITTTAIPTPTLTSPSPSSTTATTTLARDTSIPESLLAKVHGTTVPFRRRYEPLSITPPVIEVYKDPAYALSTTTPAIRFPHPSPLAGRPIVSTAAPHTLVTRAMPHRVVDPQPECAHPSCQPPMPFPPGHPAAQEPASPPGQPLERRSEAEGGRLNEPVLTELPRAPKGPSEPVLTALPRGRPIGPHYPPWMKGTPHRFFTLSPREVIEVDAPERTPTPTVPNGKGALPFDVPGEPPVPNAPDSRPFVYRLPSPSPSPSPTPAPTCTTTVNSFSPLRMGPQTSYTSTVTSTALIHCQGCALEVKAVDVGHGPVVFDGGHSYKKQGVTTKVVVGCKAVPTNSWDFEGMDG